MHIFIDESGTFTGSGARPSLSAVGALIIPDSQLSAVERKYRAMRRSLPQENGEVKGRRLNEVDVARVVAMLARTEVLFELNAADLSFSSAPDIAAHRASQASGVTAGLTLDHRPPAVKLAWDLRNRLEAVPLQLYVQTVLTFDLVARVLDHATMYHVQRRPRELCAFHWIIDAKERAGITDWEEWWSYMVMPWLQSRSFREPMPQLIGEDYSHFRRFDMAVPEYLKRLDGAPKDGLVADIRKIMTESFRFSAEAELGLELVDVLTNATRRALNGNLQEQGWRDIPTLMIHRKRHYVKVVGMRNPPSTYAPAYGPVLKKFSQRGRSMVWR